jgi:hypothetical protein
MGEFAAARSHVDQLASRTRVETAGAIAPLGSWFGVGVGAGPDQGALLNHPTVIATTKIKAKPARFSSATTNAS